MANCFLLPGPGVYKGSIPFVRKSPVSRAIQFVEPALFLVVGHMAGVISDDLLLAHLVRVSIHRPGLLLNWPPPMIQFAPLEHSMNSKAFNSGKHFLSKELAFFVIIEIDHVFDESCKSVEGFVCFDPDIFAGDVKLVFINSVVYSAPNTPPFSISIFVFVMF